MTPNSLETEYMKQTQRFLKYLGHCRHDLKERYIHQLRTSIKRQLTVVRFLAHIEEVPELVTSEKSSIAGIYKLAGAIREIQLNRKLSRLLLTEGNSQYETHLDRAESIYKDAFIREVSLFDDEDYLQHATKLAESMHSATEDALLNQAHKFVRLKAERIQQILSSRTDGERYHACRKHLKQMAFIIQYIATEHQIDFEKGYHDQFKKIDLLIGNWHDVELFKSSYRNFIASHSSVYNIEETQRFLRKIQRANNKRIAALHSQMNKLRPAIEQTHCNS